MVVFILAWLKVKRILGTCGGSKLLNCPAVFIDVVLLALLMLSHACLGKVFSCCKTCLEARQLHMQISTFSIALKPAGCFY